MVIDALTIVSFVMLVIYKSLLMFSAKCSGGITSKSTQVGAFFLRLSFLLDDCRGGLLVVF